MTPLPPPSATAMITQKMYACFGIKFVEYYVGMQNTPYVCHTFFSFEKFQAQNKSNSMSDLNRSIDVVYLSVDKQTHLHSVITKDNKQDH